MDRTPSNAMNQNSESQQEKCPLLNTTRQWDQAVYFTMDLKKALWVHLHWSQLYPQYRSADFCCTFITD